MLIILLAISVGILAFLLLFGIVRYHVKPQVLLSDRVRKLGYQQLGKRVRSKQRTKKEIPFVDRVLKPAVAGLEATLSRMAPKEISAAIASRIQRAGQSGKMTPGQFLLVSLIGGATMGLLIFAIVADSSYIFIQKAVMLALGTAIGAAAPFSVLNMMIQKRQEAIRQQLPEVLDLLCVSVQAGLSFDASLGKIVERMNGALVDECRRLQEDVRMGMVRRTAMKNLASRCDVPDVSLFMTSLIQAEKLGTSMGKTLRDQADNMRERRRQEVKAEALKAPVKILFPLVIFIFPALFVVTLVPTLLFLMKNM